MTADAVAFTLAYIVGSCVFSLIRKDILVTFGLDFSSLFVEWAIYYFAIIPFAIVRFWYGGHYTRRKPFWDELKDVFQVLLALFIAEGAILFLTKSSFSRLWLAASFPAALVLLPFLRILVKKSLHAAGKWEITTVVIGSGQNAAEAISALQSEPLLGFSVEHVFCLKQEFSDDQVIQAGERQLPVQGLGNDPVERIKSLGEPNIVFAMESGGIRQHLDLLEDLHREFNDIYVVPALRGLPLYGTEINMFFRHEVLLLRVRNILSRRMPRLMKRVFDVVGAFLLLMVCSPLFAFLVLRIRGDGGSAFYAHQRIGFDGQPFGCLKFRSMVIDADGVLEKLLENDADLRAEWAADFKLKEDPRVTPVGAFLRRTSLDELPQLLNVLRGEMSLVGPRPVVADEMTRYGNNSHYYKSVRPGMTGLWQISGRNDTDYSNRVYLDAWYVKNWSLWTDIVILVKTIGVVLNRQGAY